MSDFARVIGRLRDHLEIHIRPTSITLIFTADIPGDIPLTRPGDNPDGYFSGNEISRRLRTSAPLDYAGFLKYESDFIVGHEKGRPGTDYNRHLEQLLNRVTSLVITSLRTKLTENLEQVSKLHEDLEQVRRLFDENVAGIIMDVQLNQFLNKINKLSELVSKMKLCEPCHESELLDIESDLKKLSDLVKQDKCLNAGGKFEWVDSVLVKCLQDGTWLLIDQVNLCSPAVLDRLNGLLEPNGVLTIGERGVNGEGNVVTIKPHKNFRLFLTMDPRYGEISRAMRNRGVEIYMLGAKENIDYDAIDLQSLLFNAGIARSAQRAALLDIYKRVSTEIVTVDRLGAVDLLHTAFLVKQRTLRGFPTGQSIRDACIDVYVKTRPMSDRVFKEERLIALIDEAIEQHVARDEQQASMIDLDAATWSVSNLQKNLRLTIIRQQGLLLNAAVKIHVSRSKLGSGSSGRDIATTKLLNDFCNLEENEEFALVIDIVDALPHLLLNFFEQSSQGDVQLRKRWISKMLRQNAIFGNFERKIELMAKVIASFRFRNSPLPWNLWQLVGRKITCHENDSVCSDANKLLLLLYAYNMVLNNDVIPTENEILEDKNIMSVKQYSAIIHKGTLFSRLKNQPLITYFVEFIERASSCIGAILQVYDVTANSEEYVELRKDLMWYARFVQLGEMTLINKSEKSKDVFINLEQISLLLRVHYKWLLKFLRRLFTIVERSSRDAIPLEVGRLVDLVDDLNGQLGSVYDPIKKISKRIKKHLTLPPPHSSETCMNVHSGLRRITQKLDARDKSGNILREEWRIVAVQLDDALAMRHRAISLWREIHSGSPIDTTTWQTILEMEQLCESYTCLRSSGNNESVLSRVKSLLSEAKMTQLNMKTQLWPIYEYVFLSLACTLQGEMCRSGIISTAECLARFADLPSIPSDLMSLLDTMARTEVEQKQKLALLPELFRRLAQFAQQSYAVKDTSRLLQWHGITAEEDEGMSECVYTESKMECYFGGPVLFNLMLQLMLNKTSQEKEKKVSSAVALGTYAKKMDQLQLLNEILWRNSISLTSKRYDLSSSDLITLKFYLRLYMSAIDKMNIEYNVRDLIAIAMKKQGTRAVDIEHKLQIDYFQPLEDLHRACDEINTIDEENAGEEENILHRGRTWMSLGYIQLLLFGNLDLIDPVHKVELKLKYLEQDIVDCKRTMYVATLQNRILGMSAEDEYAHPKLAATRNCELRLLKTRDDLNYLKAFRPSSVNFASLSEESANFRNEVASYKLVEKHASSLCAIARKIRQNCDSADLIAAEITSREAESWSLSVQQFAEQIEAKYLSAYPDVIIPLMTALAQLRHGVCILINEIRRLTSLRKSTVANLEFLIHNLLRFPTIGQQQDSLLTLSGLCASTSARELISENLRSADTFVRMREQFRIFKSGLHEMHNHVILNRGLTKSLWWNINELLQQIVLIWKQQQQEEERRAAERDSLYKNKIKSHAPAEEDDELALIHKMFPKHDAKDFDDIENTMPSLNGNGNVSVEMDTSDETELSLSGLITKDDMKEIQQIHSNIVTSFIASKWMCNSPVSMCSTDYIGPLIQRYNTVHGMIKDILPSLSEGLATRLYNSFNLLVTLELQANQDKSVNQQTLWENAGRQTTKAYNFYNDCNIEEVKQCLPVCQSILSRVDELLKEWPENPILRSIRCIIERIYTFPTISPVSRFLTGLELLLEKMHQWEEFAHSGVRMVDHISALTQQIISWRKLELSCWKACLDTVYEDLRSDTSKWWFFLYALIESYVTKSACNDTEIARANDEQPITRQELVESLEHFMTESSLVEFEARLNLLLTFHCHVYYLDDNDDKNEISAVLWNMYSYYKQFVDDVKTQIAALKAPIEKKLKDIIKIVRWTGTNHWAVRKSAEATHRQLHKYVKEFQNALKQSVSTCLIVKFITRTETLLVKAKKLCKEIILGNSYSMTLGNYFKMLTQMGVSYRAGGLMLKNNADKVTDFTVPSLDLSTIDRYFNLRNIDQHMLKHWQGCEKYYYKSLVRLNALNAMLSTNHTDLGLQNIERCRGYSAHLMLMAHRQKRTIAQSFDRFSSLRIQLANLSESCEQDLTTSKQREGQNCAENLKTLLITIEAGFEQLLLFLQCCPADSSTDPGRAMLTLHANALPITAASQNDEAWKNANALVKDGLNSIKAVAKHIEHPIWENIAFFDMKMECSLRDFERLRESAEVDNEERSKATNNAIEQYELALEQFINTILLVIQKKYKDRINMNDDATHTNENSKEKNNEDDVEKEMQENVLKEKLVDSLEKDITELKLSTISDSFFNLLLSIRELDLQSANYCTGLLLKCLPLLEQYMLLSQFYLNEQVAAFRVTCKMLYLQLNVFLDLAANGFCVPKHLDLEEGETDESGEKTEKGGMGLADGEGTKDVSDRIESEDQLEDAKLADQEQEKQEDKTCKEEEKGIDMSEDFDSKLQDLEKGNKDEEEQSDDDDEEDDLDKEMGETGEGAEQLDKEIWGDDKEESDDDNQPENEDEKEGKGEQTGEKELTAKDDTDRKRQHDDDDTDENQQEDSKKEINELNEPEVNEDQVDPYYGNFQPQPEPEPFDLPEDLNLDENEEENNDGPQEENPFDIDEMKDSKPPPQEKDAKLDEETDDDKENDSGKEDVQQESGHTGSSKQEIISGPQRNITQPMKKNKPSRSNEDRTLLDRYEPLPKKLKTVYTQEEVSRSEKEDDLGSHSNEAEMAQHIHKDSQKFDDYTLDAATEDQLKQQASNEDKENEKEEKEDDCMDVEMHEDEQTDTTNDKVTEQKPEKVSEANERQKDTSAEKRIGNDVEMETPIEFEGEETKMPWVQRGNECIFNTMECNLEQDDLTSNYVESKRSELEKILSEWTQIPSTEEAAAAWNDLCSITDAAARDLSEKLRLILEPTQASRLKGDYKTGKRINMRKIIPYIASQFRKDKIWLRRTKPSKRDYQIIIAVDDSSSVSNNKSKEMIFESLALISKAMTYLEVGQLGVFNFGSTIKLLHPLGETFTEQTGNRIMQEMTYDQKETLYSEAVNFAMGMFENQRGSSDNAKLMIILSDGMGVNSEGKGIIQSVVKRARMQDIFLIFIIAENPNGKFSVLDYYTTRLEESGLVMEPYMDSFPFPFYVILRDTNALPSVLSDALRQWFEIVGKIDS
ncbi:Midasin [Ooceraea biroi]|uniref:Midasin n=1 Tax=Ooceraea biroi TaxID=2015173 RepID=A0A026X100_OOCBI|nr:Midasin [Ooceraea biroi]